MNRTRLLVLLLALSLPVFMVGCSDDDDPTVTSADIVDTAVAAGDFNTLAAALEAADLVDTLKGPGPFTVFAPTDAAFAALPPGTLDDLLLPQNQQQLIDILLYHVSPGTKLSGDVVAASTLDTALLGQILTVDASGPAVQINSSNLVQVDIEASNGVIHVIDAVLLPPSP